MHTLPALKLKMGSTEYFLATMPAGQLVSVVRPASEALEDWDNLEIEERIQRDINLKRLYDEVIPYLAQHPDRFFGSVIVLLDGDVAFESLGDLGLSVPAAYRTGMTKLGMLSIASGNMIALDGQHRLVALREILERRYRGESNPGIADDDVSVVFIAHESKEKTRRIFNKVNRYARATSRSDNLILSEDDGYAIIARWLFTREGAPLFTAPHETSLVNWKNSTISARSLQLTTISALSVMAQDICEAHGIVLDEKSSGGRRPDDDELAAGYELVANWLTTLIEEFPVLERIRRNPALLPTERSPESMFSLLLKPAGQISLVKAGIKWREHDPEFFDLADFMSAASQIDWTVSGPAWDSLLVLGGKRILAKKSNYEDAALAICWQAFGQSSNYPERLKQKLIERWDAAHLEDDKPLPQPVNHDSKTTTQTTGGF